MPFDGNGVFSYTPTTVTPAVGSTTIDSAEFNTFTADLATALSLCLTEDGQNEPIANLPMNGNKHTGVANGAARNDYTAIGQLQDGAVVYGSAGGAADVQTLTLSPAITAYSAGQRFSFVPVANNTGACTLNVNAVGDKSIKLVDGTDPAANDLNSSGIAEVIYNGTNFILINPATFTATALAALTATWANKTLTSPVINTSVSGTAFLDEDNMASNSADKVASQQSIKAYVDNLVKCHGGRVTSAGAIIVQSGGISSSRTAVGTYIVTHNLGHTNYSPVANPSTGFGLTISTNLVQDNSFRVFIKITEPTPGNIDAEFNFTIIEW